MSDDNLPTVASMYRGPVTPVKRRRTRGTLYEDEFTHGEVHIDGRVPQNLPDKAETEVKNGKLFYKYPGKVPIMVDEDGAYRHRKDDHDDAEEQAFFVLSMLASAGKVSRWRKK